MASSTAATDLTADENNVKTLLADLESQKTLITNCSLLYSHLVDHFTSLNQALTSKTETLNSNLEALDLSTSETLAALASRTAAIPSLESSAAASIAATRDAVIADIETEALNSPNPRNVLKWICRRMDGAQLWRHVAATSLRAEEVREAVLKEAIDPGRLVVDAVSDFIGAANNDDDNTNNNPNNKYWVINLLVKCLFDSDGKKKKVEVGESLAGRAAVVAEMWNERFLGKMKVEEVKKQEQKEEEEVKEEKKQEQKEEEEDEEDEEDEDEDVKEKNKQEQEGEEEKKEGEEGDVDRKGGEIVQEMEKKGREGKKGDEKERSMEAKVFLQFVAAFGLERRFERGFLRKVFVKYVRSKELARLAPMLGLEDSLGGINIFCVSWIVV